MGARAENIHVGIVFTTASLRRVVISWERNGPQLLLLKTAIVLLRCFTAACTYLIWKATIT